MTDILQIDLGNLSGLEQHDKLLQGLGKGAPAAISRAMNRTVDTGRAKVVKALARQTGLPQKTTRKAVVAHKSNAGKLEVSLRAAGGDVALKFFKPRETRAGVMAQPFGERELFAPKIFMRGGAFPRRVDIGMGGHIFERVGGRTDLEKLKSGVVIPEQMIEGESLKAWENAVDDTLPRRLDHEIGRLLG